MPEGLFRLFARLPARLPHNIHVGRTMRRKPSLCWRPRSNEQDNEPAASYPDSSSGSQCSSSTSRGMMSEADNVRNMAVS